MMLPSVRAPAFAANIHIGQLRLLDWSGGAWLAELAMGVLALKPVFGVIVDSSVRLFDVEMSSMFIPKKDCKCQRPSPRIQCSVSEDHTVAKASGTYIAISIPTILFRRLSES